MQKGSSIIDINNIAFMQNYQHTAAKDNRQIAEQSIHSRFEEIYVSTSKSVLAYITAKCGRTADINDIFQDTYLELFQTLNKRGPEYVIYGKAFVLRLAKRKLSKYYSLGERLKMFVSMTAPDDDGKELDISDFDVEAFLMEDFAVNEIMLENVWQFINQKPENVKKVFYFFYHMELTISEIAKTLGLSESDVKNKLYRTLKELRSLLK